MADQASPEKIMFLGKNYYYYQGLAGAWIKPRALGAFNIYVAPNTHFRIRYEAGDWVECLAAAVPPNVRHQIVSDCGSIVAIGVEPELVADAALRALQRDVAAVVNRNGYLVRSIGPLQDFFACPTRSAGLQDSDFDQLVFGRRLEAKAIDPRIAAALAYFDDNLANSGLSAQDCAGEVQLSTSRFLHLFKETTGISFRSFRMWKRARCFLAYANQDSSLTKVALDLGYPDSSHFSHSIRKTYGLKPRSIRDGSRDLKVHTGSDYRAHLQLMTA